MWWVDLHCHSESSLFRVSAGQGHPSDVQRMREGSECLRPHDTKVSDASKATELREDSVEDVSKKMQA